MRESKQSSWLFRPSLRVRFAPALVARKKNRLRGLPSSGLLRAESKSHHPSTCVSCKSQSAKGVYSGRVPNGLVLSAEEIRLGRGSKHHLQRGDGYAWVRSRCYVCRMPLIARTHSGAILWRGSLLNAFAQCPGAASCYLTTSCQARKQRLCEKVVLRFNTRVSTPKNRPTWQTKPASEHAVSRAGQGNRTSPARKGRRT